MVDFNPHRRESAKVAEAQAAEQLRDAKQSLADAQLLAVLEEKHGRAVLLRICGEIDKYLTKGFVPLDARAHYERAPAQLLAWLRGECVRVNANLTGVMFQESER